MPDARYEEGIGETRAILFEDGQPVEYRIERPGLRVGERALARLLRREGPRAFVRMGEADALLDSAPPGVPEGGLLTVEVKREAIPEPGRARLPRVAALAADTPPRSGRTLLDRLPTPVRHCTAHEADLLEAGGWSEALEEARTGRFVFSGGTLVFTRTSAFLAVDVDGPGAPADLACDAATALARAIRRFDLGGSIVIDFPTLSDRAARIAVGNLLDTCLQQPFERTAMNGYGLVQIVRPKLRPSLLDYVQGEPTATAALALLRSAERASRPGELSLIVPAGVEAWLASRPHLLADLARRTGRSVRLACASPLPIS